MATKIKRRAYRDSSKQERHARRVCNAPCKVYFKKMSAAFNADKSDKVVQYHANRYWHCVWDCMETRLPRKSSTRRSIATKRRKRGR